MARARTFAVRGRTKGVDIAVEVTKIGGMRSELLAREAPLLRRKWVLVTVAGVVVLPVVAFALWSAATLAYAYSNGERAGYLQKLSDKGWICKTWEGELAMQNLPGTAPEIFRFSVRDGALAKQIQELEGQKVVLNYEQHKGVPSSCFGETEYFVTGAKKVER